MSWNDSKESGDILYTVKYSFGWIEYLVCGLVLLFSSFIGIFFGCFGSKQSSVSEFLTGNKTLTPFPIGMSIICSLVSAIAFLGISSEIYLYGSQMLLMVVNYVPCILATYYFYVPVYRNLNITSSFEYIQKRFDKILTDILSSISIIFLLPYMCLIVYTPCIAIKQVAGIPITLSVSVTYAVCIFYSTLGGLRSVIWTDTFQGIIMIVTLILIVVKGFLNTSPYTMWERLSWGNRTNLLMLDPDPRTRNTIWTTIIGYGVFWFTGVSTSPSIVQRFVSLPDDKSVKLALTYAALGMTLILGLCSISGMLIFAQYYNCDPIRAKTVQNSEQLMPKYAIELLGDYKGFPGLFVAAILSASLSTVSSGINTLSAIVIQNFILKWKPEMTDRRQGHWSKLVSLIGGFISFLCLFMIQNLDGVLTGVVILVGCLTGPTFSVYTLGMFFPMVNSRGARYGFILGQSIMLVFGSGSIYANIYRLTPDQKIATDISGCKNFKNHTNLLQSSLNITTTRTNWKDNEHGLFLNIMFMSQYWFPLLGSIITIVFGIIFSLIFLKIDGVIIKTKSEYLSPPIIPLWKKLLGSKYSKYVDDEKSSIGRTIENLMGIYHIDTKNDYFTINGNSNIISNNSKPQKSPIFQGILRIKSRKVKPINEEIEASVNN